MACVASLLDDQPTPLSLLELPPRAKLSPVNRRTLPRSTARFTLRPRAGGCEYRGIDLSFGGLMCVGEDPLWPGNVVALDLLLPGDAPIAIDGRIVDLVGYRGQVAMRIRFDNLDLSSRKRIAAWMASVQKA